MDMKFSNKQANILKWTSESSEIISEFTNELTNPFIRKIDYKPFGIQRLLGCLNRQ